MVARTEAPSANVGFCFRFVPLVTGLISLAGSVSPQFTISVKPVEIDLHNMAFPKAVDCHGPVFLSTMTDCRLAPISTVSSYNCYVRSACEPSQILYEINFVKIELAFDLWEVLPSFKE